MNEVAAWGQNTEATIGNGTLCSLPPCGEPVP